MERVDLHSKYEKYNSATRFLLASLKLHPKIIDYSTLKELGFISLFLYDKTGVDVEYFPNSLLMIFNPSVSFFEEKWDDFTGVVKEYPNFIKIIDYSGLIFGVWMKVKDENFGKNLRYNFKLGKYSEFPIPYIAYLNEFEKKICMLDEKYRKTLEIKLGLDEDQLIDCELFDVPLKESYIFKL
tara:strand:+ start:7189 stop:7737 length:549 start_codon:yes stop_codon:yes gene_type:complete